MIKLEFESKKLIRHWVIFILLCPFILGSLNLFYNYSKATDMGQFIYKNNVAYENGWKLRVQNAEMDAASYFTLNNMHKMDLNIVSLSRNLPDKIMEDEVIAFYGYYGTAKIFIDGKKVLQDEPNKTKSKYFGEENTKSWCSINLNPSYEGKQIHIILESKNDSNVIYNIVYGDKLSVAFETIRPSGILIICVSLMFVAIIISMFMMVILRKDEAVRRIFYMILYIFVIGLYFFMQTGIVWAFTSDRVITESLEYIFLVLWVFPMYMFLKEVLGEKSGTVDLFVGQYTLFLIVLFTLKVLGIVELNKAMTFLNLEMVLFLIIGIILIFIFNRSSEENLIKKGMFFLLVAIGLLAEIAYYRVTFKCTCGFATATLILAVFLEIKDGIGNTVKYIEQTTESKYYELLSIEDKMTGCKNQNAFIRDLRKLKNKNLENYSVAVMDLDKLKHINDEYGHRYGDDAIKQAIQCFYMAFEGDGTFYRRGGDEFIWIGRDYSSEKLDDIIKYFDKLCALVDLETKYHFGASIAYSQYNPETDISIETTIDRADKKMYEVKKTHHYNINKTFQ